MTAPSFSRIALCLALGSGVALATGIVPWRGDISPELAVAEAAEVTRFTAAAPVSPAALSRADRFWRLAPAVALASRSRGGRSAERTWLRAPLAVPRVSSEFGMRLHPLLDAWLPHRGVDYAAAEGTPVQSVSEGIVRFAGTKRFYGIGVDVDHADGSMTRYAHLSALAPALRAGKRVRAGETIGFVGHTGRATGPHLHFEFLVDGRSREPLGALIAARLVSGSR